MRVDIRITARVVAALLTGLASTASVLAQAPEAGDAARADAADRPRIGLVLSGGGARGAAHVGVLKVLEQLQVPIDAIAGTSMGAVVGGLYASGLSASEIETLMTSANFRQAFSDRPPRSQLTFRRKQEDLNFLVKFPLGLRGRRFLLPKGLIQGQTLHQILRRLTAPVAAITDFDDLPTPFRAVATDLETGDAVVLGEGDLTTAMRASLSAPGVFAPVERDGRLLVDGGIAANLPVDIAREMGVDVLIVVDVGFPLLERDRLGSAPVISNQMLAILIRRDTRRQRESLNASDIIIDPALGDASSFDFSRIDRAIEVGRQAAINQTYRLQAFALAPDAHEHYVAQRSSARTAPPRIDFVRVEPGSERYAHALEARFEGAVGKPLDAEALGERVTLFYGQGNLETLDYRIVEDEERYGLALTARRNSWGPNYVRFGLNLQDDFEGSSSYNAAARFVLAEITRTGGESVWDLQIGENPRIATEVYLPLSQGPGFFLMPHAQLGARNVAVLDDQQRRIAELRVRTFDYGLDFGREFGNWGELRAGYGRAEGVSRVRLGDPALPTGDFDSDDYFARFSYDQLDDVNFPRHGQTLTLEWVGQRFDVGPVQTAERVRLDWLAARSWGKQTAVLWSSMGTTIGDVTDDVRSLFGLGGFLNLSGLQPDSLTGPHFGIVRGLVYRQIGRGGPGVFDVPAYIGVSYEVGNVWNDRDIASFGSARRDGSLFLGLDSLVGPVYLAVGIDEAGEESFYLFLGRTF
ncbi:MAG: patatin-like phospholipase family protein [Steroidobacteraceae bacterium]